MNTQPRRRHADNFPNEARVNIAASTVRDNCRLVRANSFPYVALLAQDFEEIDREGDCVLMRAPAGYEVAQERA